MSDFSTSDPELLAELENCSTAFEQERFFYKTLKQRLRGVFERIRDGENVTTDPMREPLRLLVQYLREEPEYLGMLIQLGPEDEETYRHCVDVAILSCLYAQTDGWEESKTITLGLAALFHDVGKMKIPKSTLRTEGSLSNKDRQTLQKHPEIGKEMLGNAGLNGPLQRAAYGHHERPDGSGYPEGRTEIDEMTRIISVVDMYDALLSHRVYRRGMLPSKIEELMEEEFRGYESTKRILRTFFKALRRNRFATLARLTDKRLVLLRHYYQVDRERTIVVGRSESLSSHGYPVELDETSASIEKTLSPDEVPFEVEDLIDEQYLGLA